MTRTPPAPHPSFARRLACFPLLVGAVALLAACDSDVPSADGSTTSSTLAEVTTTVEVTTTTEAPTTTAAPTTTEPPLVTEGGIVKVANCSGVDGAAGKLTDALAKQGFTTRKATNGAGIDEDLQDTKIYVVPGAEEVARSVSTLLGGVPLEPMPTPAWISGANEELADATVLVMLGHDLAGKKLSAIKG